VSAVVADHHARPQGSAVHSLANPLLLSYAARYQEHDHDQKDQSQASAR